MPDYRIYKLDRGGHVAEPPRIVTHVADAIAETKQLLDGYDLQLWEGGRLVLSLESKDKEFTGL